MSDTSAARGRFTVTAHGRVNLIGEHTDYNDGFVLPMAIGPCIRVRVTPRADRRALLHSEHGPPASLDLERPLQPGDRGWSCYPAGVIAQFQRLGWSIPGFEATISADLPAGGGLSSSAALEVATATAVEMLCGQALPPEEKALLCQQAEHEFADVPCGIMDQFAVTCCRAGHALLLDCRSRILRHVPFAAADVRVLVIDSGVRHRLADGEYARRRAECASAARHLRVPSLRDVDASDWQTAQAALPEPERSRTAHVISENDRTLAFADAVAQGDWPAAGRLMKSSHASLSRDYQVSCRELDLIAEIAAALPGVHGCRMTGGGFGGCAVALVEAAAADRVRAEITSRYRAATGIDPRTFVTAAAAGLEVAGD